MSDLYANVNGIKICYETFGQGYPIFLLHGFGMYKQFWLCQIGVLSKKFKVIAYDLRGCGKSDRPNQPYTIDLLVEDQRALMDALKVDKAHIMGHSLGGMIVQNFALKYPNRVNKIVLLGTNPAFPPDPSGIEMFKNTQIASFEMRLKDPEKWFFDRMGLRFTRNFVKQMKQDRTKKFHNLFSTEELIKYEDLGPTSKENILNLGNAFTSHNVLNRLPEIRNSTLVLTGDQDRITPKSSSELIHQKIKSSAIKVFVGGHFFPLESAPEVNLAIMEFLGK